MDNLFQIRPVASVITYCTLYTVQRYLLISLCLIKMLYLLEVLLQLDNLKMMQFYHHRRLLISFFLIIIIDIVIYQLLQLHKQVSSYIRTIVFLNSWVSKKRGGYKDVDFYYHFLHTLLIINSLAGKFCVKTNHSFDINGQDRNTVVIIIYVM